MFANNRHADQPAHPRSLISAFVIRVLESIISKLAISEIPTIYLVYMYEAYETALSLTLSETQKAGFVTSRPIRNLTWRDRHLVFMVRHKTALAIGLGSVFRSCQNPLCEIIE